MKRIPMRRELVAAVQDGRKRMTRRIARGDDDEIAVSVRCGDFWIEVRRILF
jgi:hypothetical protein